MKALCRPILPLIIPVTVVCVTCFLSVKTPMWAPANYARELAAFSVFLPMLPYAFIGAALLLAWRFRQTGMVLSASFLGIVYWAVHRGGCTPGSGCQKLLTGLLFLEVALFSQWRWRQLPLKTAVSWLGAMVLQTVLLLGIGQLLQEVAMRRPGRVVSSPLLEHCLSFFNRWDMATFSWFQPETVLFCIVGLYLLIFSLRKQDVLLAGILGALVSVYIGLGPFRTAIEPSAAFLSAGLILVLACIEASFIMAYRDELTGLPSRRALNQTLVGLGSHYAIAMIDVDHFKRFNDIYGHKTGDQVLKLLAARLTRMSGGAKAFRYGGEEFTAVFAGKSVEDAFPHLETCRKRLAANPFIVRGKMRRKTSADLRGKIGFGKTRKQARVTASFGVAEPSQTLRTPNQVIAAADKALYRAKKAGRNCVKT